MSGLRSALELIGGGSPIVTAPSGYSLQADPESIDALRFEQLVTEGSSVAAEEPERGVALLEQALELWRGAPLSDFEYSDFACDPARRLERLRLDALEALAAADLERGRPQEALSRLEPAIREDPLRERLRELQIVALYRCGRHPEALHAYRRFHRFLADELGLVPSPALQQLNEQVLLHRADIERQSARSGA